MGTFLEQGVRVLGLIVAFALSTGPFAAEQAAASLTISAQNAGGWGDFKWWFVDLEGTGKLQVRIQGEPRRVSQVAEEALARVTTAIDKERFFDLPAVDEGTCVDCSVCRLKVRFGAREREVSIGRYQRAQPEERARALRVWDVLKAVAGIADLEDACH